MERSQVLVLVVMFLSCTQAQTSNSSTVVMATTWMSNITGTNATLQSTEAMPSPALDAGTSPSSDPPTSFTPPPDTAATQTDIQPSSATQSPAAPSQSPPGSGGDVTFQTPVPPTAGSGCVSAGRRLQQLLLAAACMLLQRATHT